MNERHGPQLHPTDHALLVDAFLRGARVSWRNDSGAVRLPGSGYISCVRPWEVEAAYREIVAQHASLAPDHPKET